MQLGYVGLGNMGAALARRLLRKDKMRLYDLRPEAMEKFAGLGGIASQSPKALAAESDLVMTCPDRRQGDAGREQLRPRGVQRRHWLHRED